MSSASLWSRTQNHRENLLTKRNALFLQAEKSLISKLRNHKNTCTSCKHFGFLQSPSPSLAGSNGDRRSGSSPGSSSSLLCAFPGSTPVDKLQIRSLIQWRDRAGLQPAFLLSLSTPNPIRIQLSMSYPDIAIIAPHYE